MVTTRVQVDAPAFRPGAPELAGQIVVAIGGERAYGLPNALCARAEGGRVVGLADGAAHAVHIMVNDALTGIDGGQQLIAE